MLRKIKTIILKFLTPFQKLLQNISKKEPMMTREQVNEILNLINEGDILLSYESGRFTSPFIKGYYKHAAIISSKLTVVEAVGSGVREVDLEEWLFDKDSVALIRPFYENKTINKIAAATSLYYIGKPYDYSFTLVDERVYCSELVYLCYSSDKDFLKQVDHDDILPNEYYDLCFDETSNLKLIKQFKNI